MKIVIKSNVNTEEKLRERLPALFAAGHQLRFYTLAASDDALLADADADILIVDAMGSVSARLIAGMPGLKLIQSEGVGYQGFDVAEAKRRGIPVCNNRGINDSAVAEHTLLLILACLKNARNMDAAVRRGKQMEAKKECFGVLRELSECTVGLIGFGDIARKTAEFLKPFGPRVLVTNRTFYPDAEAAYGVQFAKRDVLLKESDFVSLHLPVNADTEGLADADFFARMKTGACLINTARGELVDNRALYEALRSGKLAMAGLDVLAPEPVLRDHILLDPQIADQVLLSPHVAGLSSLTIKKLYQGIEENIRRIQNGEPPLHQIGEG